MTATITTSEQDYWTPEPIENEAVAGWLASQPQPTPCPLARYCPNTGTDKCDDGTGCPSC